MIKGGGFTDKYANLVDRLPQYHIASHLGITPTIKPYSQKTVTYQPM